MAQVGRYRAYPAYKPSGVEWLGDIPEGWETFHFKRTVDGCVNGFWGDNPSGGTNDTIVVRVADFDRPKLTLIDEGYSARSIRPSEKANRKLNYGDLLIEKSGGGEKTLVGQVVQFQKRFEAVTSNFVAKMTPHKHFDSTFLTYAFHSAYSINLNFRSVKQSTGIQNLDSNAYLCETWTFPPLFEQTQIAAFLDYETAKIDALIAKQERLIALLEEKRQAVISHAVTKGLDPTAPLRPSGIDWLGDVPAHWEVKSLKLIVSTRKGVAFKADDFCEDGVRVAKASDIKRLSLELSEVFLPRRYTETYPKAVLAEGNIVLSTVGSNPIVRNSAVGQVGRVPKSQSGSLLNQNTVVFDVDKEAVEENYVFAALLTRGYRDHLDLKAHGTANQSSLNVADMLDFFIPLPPATEQIEIAKHLQKNAQLFDDLGASSDAAITLLKERRTALISAAVTGKIDVRDWQAPAALSTQDISQDA